MKRLIAIFLLLAMALCLCACGSDNKEPRYLGTWKTEDGTATLTLDIDGTAKMVLAGEESASYNFLWTAESVTSLILKWDGAPVPAAGNQTATDDAADAAGAEAAEVTEAADAAETAEGTVSRNDPSLVGISTLRIVNGEMWLTFSEGSSNDALLFIYGFKKIA